jgi:hypothetical protein
MSIKILLSMWGWKELLSPEELLERAKESGYDGIDGEPPLCSPTAWQKLRADYGMANFILVGGEDIDEQVRRMKMAAEFAPDGIISHTGSDTYSFDDGCRFLERCLKVEAELGIPVVHETHRGKLFYHPVVTARYVETFPEVKINADFAHFVVACESLLEPMQPYLDTIISRCFHIHGRVAQQEASQVADPRAPEFQPHVERHEQWWDAIKAAREVDGTPTLHFTPEFGPHPYMPALPYTQQPVASLWDVNLWMAQRQRRRWGLD